jgi:hypothetical protein
MLGGLIPQKTLAEARLPRKLGLHSAETAARLSDRPDF